MKYCPNCHRTYTDDRLNYCRNDGVSLQQHAAHMVAALACLAGETTTAQLDFIDAQIARLGLAVMPFVNASGAPELAFLCEGITESIINRLSQLPGLRVVARGTVFRYAGSDPEPRQIARQLGVDAVVTGRVRQAGDRLMIGVELTNARQDAQLWGEHYYRQRADLFDVQEEIAQIITAKLCLQLSAEDKARLAKRPTHSAASYELYLQGRYHWNKLAEEGFYKAIEYFERALEKDNKFALAAAGLAEAYGALSYFNFLRPHDVIGEVKRFSLKAIGLDHTLAQPHLMLATVKLFHERDWDAAAQGFQRALALNPNYADAHHMNSHYLVARGQYDAAIAEMRVACQLDPLSPVMLCGSGFALYRARRYEDALEQFRLALGLDERFPLAHEGVGQALEQLGRHDEAFAAYSKVIPWWGGKEDMIPLLADAYRASGLRGFWRKWIELSTAHRSGSLNTHYFTAGVYALLGENDASFAWLEKSLAEGEGFLIYLNGEPRFDNVRSDARFPSVLRRVGLIH